MSSLESVLPTGASDASPSARFGSEAMPGGAGRDASTTDRDGIAIRAEGLGRRFEPRLNLDNPDGRLVWEILMRIIGLRVKSDVVRARIGGGDAIVDADFAIAEGEVVALVGASGSGKTTLLRMLSGSLRPTAGQAVLRGSVASLISVGENLNDEFSALENIEAQRALLGRPKAVSRTYAQEIIAFADLQGFESVPVKQYSSGMRLRLSLAMAIQGGPDILLIDDVLGVGDIAFQHKCVEHLARLKDEGRTVVMVSHDDDLVARVATRTIELRSGRIVADRRSGGPGASRHAFGLDRFHWTVSPYLPENDVLAVTGVSAHLVHDETSDPELAVEVTVVPKIGQQKVRPSLDIAKNSIVLMRNLAPRWTIGHSGVPIKFETILPIHQLQPGQYFVTLGIVSDVDGEIFSRKQQMMVIERYGPALDVHPAITSGLVLPPADWDIEPVAVGPPLPQTRLSAVP